MHIMTRTSEVGIAICCSKHCSKTAVVPCSERVESDNRHNGSELTVELKIRRASALGGSIPPPGTKSDWFEDSQLRGGVTAVPPAAE